MGHGDYTIKNVDVPENGDFQSKQIKTDDIPDLTNKNGGIWWYNGMQWVYVWEHANESWCFHLLASKNFRNATRK